MVYWPEFQTRLSETGRFLPRHVTREFEDYLMNKAGFKISQARTGAVTSIQRFGSALNLNLHFHVLFIDGVFSPKSNGDLRFHRVNAPTSKELNALLATISDRVARYLEGQGRPARVGWPEMSRAII